MYNFTIYRKKTIEIKSLVPILLFALILFLLVGAIGLKTNSSSGKNQHGRSSNIRASHIATTTTLSTEPDKCALEKLTKTALSTSAVADTLFYDEYKKQITISSYEPEAKIALQIYEKEEKLGGQSPEHQKHCRLGRQVEAEQQGLNLLVLRPIKTEESIYPWRLGGGSVA